MNTSIHIVDTFMKWHDNLFELHRLLIQMILVLVVLPFSVFSVCVLEFIYGILHANSAKRKCIQFALYTITESWWNKICMKAVSVIHRYSILKTEPNISTVFLRFAISLAKMWWFWGIFQFFRSMVQSKTCLVQLISFRLHKIKFS